MENSILHSNFFSGLSGLQLPVPKYKLPEEYQIKSRLAYYASLFNSIEINSTFYKKPLSATIARWKNIVGENFRFTFKLWKQITHAPLLCFEKNDVDSFIKSISLIEQKAGCLLIQFPPSLGVENMRNLNLLLEILFSNIYQRLDIAIEFRNKSWYVDETYDLLNKFKAILVLHDFPKGKPPFLEYYSEKMYIRFHGPAGNYRESYPDDFLSEYAVFINEWCESGKIVYCYFNNTMGDAFNNLRKLNEFVNKICTC